MPQSLHGVWWAQADVAPAVTALARHAGIDVPEFAETSPPATESLHEQIDAACVRLGLECEEVPVCGQGISVTLRAAAPAILSVPGRGVLVLMGSRGGRAQLLTPDGELRSVALTVIRQLLWAKTAEPHAAAVEHMVRACGIEPRSRSIAADALLESRVRREVVGTLYPVRVPPGTSFRRQLRDAGVGGWITAMIAAHAAEYGFLVAAWAVIGRGALQGRVDAGRLVAWLLLLATMVPCRLLATWAQGVITVRAGGLLRQRLLAGILGLEPNEVRHEGVGGFLARAIEVEMVESLALSGGLNAVLAIVEWVAAALVLVAGGASLELPLLVGWSAVAALLAWRYWRARRTWTDARLKITHEVVERMLGHRTRLAQQPREAWHRDEDAWLAAYLATSRTMDAAAARLEGLIPRGWFVVGLLGLAPVFLSAQLDASTLAITVGGVVLAWRAFRRLTTGLAGVSGAAISWSRVAPLFYAASRREATAAASPVVLASDVVVRAQDLGYAYPDRGPSVVAGLNLEIRRGDKVLLEGPSGGGKSTLVALLAGLRAPTTGSLWAGGLDHAMLGANRWRRRIGAAPQYHDNHILGGSLAYNLLLGRRWPATEEDLRRAEVVARDAGLGSLLDRMPGGLMQLVGETGWQLSPGERSRVFLCRALLGGAELVILDESFAALDPHSLRQALDCALRRTTSLLAVAHP